MAYSKRRRRLSKFQLSQRAHGRLCGKTRNIAKRLYHQNCIRMQNMYKRILTPDEKKYFWGLANRK